MCFVITSSEKASFCIKYLNETVFVKRSGESRVAVELLLKAKKELEKIDVIYPNIGITKKNKIDVVLKKTDNPKEHSINIVPQNQELTGEIVSYSFYDKYQGNTQKLILEKILKYSIFTINFDRPLKVNEKVWIYILFISPNACVKDSLLYVKHFIEAKFSGPLNVRKEFTDKVESYRNNIEKLSEFSEFNEINKNKLSIVFENIKSNIIDNFDDEKDYDIEKWYISVVHDPSIKKNSSTIINGNENIIKERNVRDQPVVWPFNIKNDLLKLLKFGDKFKTKTRSSNFYYIKEKDKEEDKDKTPTFQFECKGEIDYSILLTLIALLISLFLFFYQFSSVNLPNYIQYIIRSPIYP